MKDIIIVGARGYGREIYDFILSLNKIKKVFSIKGFLDDKIDALDAFFGYAPIISSVEDYRPENEDYFICALGGTEARAKYTNLIKKKGGKFVSLIHPTVLLCDNVRLGEGIVISAYCTISSNVTIGDFTIIHPFCDIGHDTLIENNCSIESYCFFGGFSHIGNNVTLHPRSTILPHIVVGDGASVGAGSVVIKNVRAGINVFGMPAKKIEF
ncbi:MAG: NeuD/PglB/VioB family sugar acetyltransferase [Anaerovoracaceae bacterium]